MWLPATTTYSQTSRNGMKFSNDDEVKQAVNGYFEGLDQSTYKIEVQALEHRWTKCIALKGDYFEK